jgi:hypothetical protein
LSGKAFSFQKKPLLAISTWHRMLRHARVRILRASEDDNLSQQSAFGAVRLSKVYGFAAAFIERLTSLHHLRFREHQQQGEQRLLIPLKSKRRVGDELPSVQLIVVISPINYANGSNLDLRSGD